MKSDGQRDISLCLACIGDAPLRAQLRDEARRVRCFSCRNRRIGVGLPLLATTVADILRPRIGIGQDVKHYGLDDDDNGWWEQEGQSLEEFLGDELQIDGDVAQRLARRLADDDPAWPGDGEEPFFARDQNYVRLRYTDPSLRYRWSELHKRPAIDTPLVGDAERAFFADVLGRPGSDLAAELPVFDLTDARAIYRARVADGRRNAVQILRRPSTELGPPPAERAGVGRMSPGGMPVFYGAFAADTAVAEIRPWVGSFVVVGEFRPRRPLRLLDLRRLGHVHEGSLFDPDYDERVNRLRFLRRFHARIVRPVAPHAETWAYRATQAVAAYVTTELGFDGILYASVQVGAAPTDPDDDDDLSGYDDDDFAPAIRTFDDDDIGQHNVVLFGAAGHVAKPRTRRYQGAEADPGLGYVGDSAAVRRVRALNVNAPSTYIYVPPKRPRKQKGRLAPVDDLGFDFDF